MAVSRSSDNLDSVLRKSDELFEQEKFEESFGLLAPLLSSKPENAEILWRLARMYYQHSKAARSEITKKSHAKKAVEFSEKSLKIDEENFVCWKVYI